MRRRGAIALAAAAFGVSVLGLGAAAHAAPSTTKNACKYSYDGNWRDHDLVLAATASGTASPGGTITLSSTTMAAELPAYIPEYGYNLGLLQAGDNAIPTKLWLAIAGSNTEEGSQVVEAEVSAVATATVDGDTVVGSPIKVDVSLPDSTWTATGNDIVVFTQAGPDKLPDGLPGAGVSGTFNPVGSLYVSSSLTAALRFNLDCQPGRFADEGKAITTGPASPFATVTGSTGAGPTTTVTTSTSATSTTVVTQRPVTDRAGTAGTSGGTGSGTGSDAAPLATTGPNPLVITLELVAGALLLDLGYLAWTASRPARRRP